MARIRHVGEAGTAFPERSLRVLLLTSCIPVARIAYIASDVIISVQPALGLDSLFSPHLHAFAANKAPGLIGKETPEVRH